VKWLNHVGSVDSHGSIGSGNMEAVSSHKSVRDPIGRACMPLASSVNWFADLTDGSINLSHRVINNICIHAYV
jgi:hypothetical protein